MSGYFGAITATVRPRIWAVAAIRSTVEYRAAEMADICRRFARRRPFFVVQGIENEDLRGRFIARLYFWEPEPPYEQSNFVLVAGSLSTLRAQMPPGLQRATRIAGDHARVLEVWI